MPRTKADLPGIGNAAICAISCENSGDRQNFRRSDKSRACPRDELERIA